MAETYVTLSSLKHYDEKNKELIATKQDKLVGAENQVVSFDENGTVISKDLEMIDTSAFAKNEDLNKKIDKQNPIGTGSLSFNRKDGTSVGDYSVAIGDRTTATGKASLAEGCLTSATAPQSHAEGDGTTASGIGAHAEGGYVDGVYTTASGTYAHAEGVGTTASEAGTHTEGYKTTATAPYAHAEGYEAKATGGVSHAEGFKTTAAGLRSHAEGIQSQTGANATAAHAEGWSTQALGVGSHAEGVETIAEGNYSHAEGGNATAIGNYSHVEGLYNDKVKQILVPGIKWTSASANFVIGMANMSNTLGLSSNHTQNVNYTYDNVSYKYKVYFDLSKIGTTSTLPTSTSNHYRGYIYFSSTDASSIYDNILLVNENGSLFIYYNNDEIYTQRTMFGSTVYPSCDIGISEADMGTGVDSYTTPDLTATHVQGKYSYVDNSYAHVVGGGTSDSDRKNIHTLDWNGNAEYLGDVKATKKDGTKTSLTSVYDKVTTIEKDYLKKSDKTSLTNAIATAKQEAIEEAIETVLGESVDADFDTLKEVADWIQSDTTASAELVTRVSNAETILTATEIAMRSKVDKENGKGLSTNDLTTTLKSKYDTAYTHSQSTHAPTNAEKNTIVGVQKNGADLTVDSSTRKVNITVPTKTSELTNDSGFKTTDNNTTYSLSKSGSTITLTGSDGSTTSVTDADTNTTYTAGTGLTLSGTEFKHSNSVTAGTAQGSSNKTLSFGGTFTIPTVTYDAQGHVTGKGTTTMTMPANPNTDTHYTSKNVVGSSTATSNTTTALTNGNVYLNSVENGAVTSTHKISGSGATTVTTDESGNIVISSTDNNTITTATTTGSGNAVTAVSASNGKLTVTKGSTFLTSHPTISKSTDTTSTASPSHGGTFTAVDSVTRDGNGHVTKVNTKTVTLPSASSLMTKSNPSGTGTFNMNGTVNGNYSSTLGYNNTAFDNYSHVEGMYNNKLSSFVKMITSSATGTCGEVSTDNMVYDGVSYVKSTKFTLGMAISIDKTSTTGYYKGKIVSGSTTVSDLLLYYDGSVTVMAYSTSYSLMNLAGLNAAVYFEESEIPPSTEATHIQGKYAKIDGTYAHVVGNGISDSNRSNAHTLDWDGNAVFAGDVKATDASGNLVSLVDLANNSGSGSSSEEPLFVGTCSTGASTSAKTVSITGFELKVGVRVYIKFSNTNTSSTSTLNISSTGAKPMYYKDGTRMYYIPNNIYHEFVYDGTNYVYMGSDNALIGGRNNERYGLKMDGIALVPTVSGYSPTLGSSSSKFGTIYANNVGTDSVPTNSVYGDTIYANTLFTKTGTYRTRVLPPLPLLYGNFTVSSYHTITFNSSVCQNYVKSLYTNYLNTNADVTSSGCAYAGSAQGNTYDVAFLFRVIGYDSTSGKQAVPFVQEFALTTAYTTMSCGDNSTDWYVFKTPCGNTVYFYLTGISVDSCGYVSGTPALNIGGTTSSVHFSEIALMP